MAKRKEKKKNSTPKRVAKKRTKKSPSAARKPHKANIVLLTNNPKIKELMKDPEWARKFEEKKQQIAEGYNQIKSPKFCKIITDEKSGLIVLVYVMPASNDRIKRSPAEVYVMTMVNNICHVEMVKFSSLKRACEYVGDFDQEQSARFCDTAVRIHAVNICNNVIKNFAPAVANALAATDSKVAEKK